VRELATIQLAPASATLPCVAGDGLYQLKECARWWESHHRSRRIAPDRPWPQPRSTSDVKLVTTQPVIQSCRIGPVPDLRGSYLPPPKPFGNLVFVPHSSPPALPEILLPCPVIVRPVSLSRRRMPHPLLFWIVLLEISAFTVSPGVSTQSSAMPSREFPEIVLLVTVALTLSYRSIPIDALAEIVLSRIVRTLSPNALIPRPRPPCRSVL